MTENITCEISNGVAVVTLNRPDQLNAFLPEMYQELVAIFDRTDSDDDVRVVLLTGAGRAFCAGADISRGGDTFNKQASSTPDSYRDPAGRAAIRMHQSLKPIVAAVNGAAVGFGASIVLPADVRVCSTNARFGYVFAARGIVNDGASSWFLPRIVGINRALEWCLTARMVNAEEAHESGLVSQVVEPDQLFGVALAIATDIATRVSPLAAVITRQLLWASMTSTAFAAHIRESRALLLTGGGDDVKEGVRSFLEKRTPEWSTRVSRDLPPFLLDNTTDAVGESA